MLVRFAPEQVSSEVATPEDKARIEANSDPGPPEEFSGVHKKIRIHWIFQAPVP
jgi:hypothetical protein